MIWDNEKDQNIVLTVHYLRWGMRWAQAEVIIDLFVEIKFILYDWFDLLVIVKFFV